MDNKTVYYRPLPPKPATLLILERGKQIRIVSLSGSMTLGRISPEFVNDISLSSGIVSKHHGEFIYDDTTSTYYYRDNHSLNGTFFNGVKLEMLNERGSRAIKLTDGDILRIDCANLANPRSDAVVLVFSTRFAMGEKWNRFLLENRSHVEIGRQVIKDNESNANEVISTPKISFFKNGLFKNNNNNTPAVNNTDGNNNENNVGDKISLPDFMVSRKHAVLARHNGAWYITDNGSVNGLAVNRVAIQGTCPLNVFDVINIANTTMIYLGNEIIYNEVYPNVQKHDYNNRSVVMGVNINEVRFGSKRLLDNINLDIESGDFILILGGSGAGKTTFIKAVMGSIKDNTTGQVMFENMDLYRNFNMLKHKIGFVPQFSTTRVNDTVYNTIMDAARIKLAGEYTRKEIVQRVDGVIQKMMLTSLKNNLIKTLSGGQLKRLEVALQAIGDQKVFILDEPDSGMDYATRVDLMGNLKNCTESGDVVMVITHAPDDAATLFTKVIVLAKSQKDEVGRLAYYGDIKNAYDFFGVKKLSEIVLEINFEGGKGRADEFIEKYERTRRG